MEMFNLIAEVGVPIAGALVMAYFIFLVMKQLMGSLVDEIKTIQAITKMLITRASIMNNDIIRMYLVHLIYHQIQIEQPGQKILQKMARQMQGEISVAQLIADFGFPVVMVVGLGYFVYYVWKTINNVIDPAV